MIKARTVWLAVAVATFASAAVALHRSQSRGEGSVTAVDAMLDCALHADENDRCQHAANSRADPWRVDQAPP